MYIAVFSHGTCLSNVFFSPSFVPNLFWFGPELTYMASLPSMKIIPRLIRCSFIRQLSVIICVLFHAAVLMHSYVLFSCSITSQFSYVCNHCLDLHNTRLTNYHWGTHLEVLCKRQIYKDWVNIAGRICCYFIPLLSSAGLPRVNNNLYLVGMDSRFP